MKTKTKDILFMVFIASVVAVVSITIGVQMWINAQEPAFPPFSDQVARAVIQAAETIAYSVSTAIIAHAVIRAISTSS